eukprot:2959535-Amphidinium_carterae.1
MGSPEEGESEAGMVKCEEEWGEFIDSDDEADTPQLDPTAARQARYARMARQIDDPDDDDAAAGSCEPAWSSEGPSRTSPRLALFCCLFFVFYNLYYLFMLSLAWRGHIIIAACLAPAAIFLAAIEVLLVWTDRSILRLRHRVCGRAVHGDVAAVLFNTFIIVFLGIFSGYRLIRAYCHWTGSTSQRTFLQELDSLHPSRQLITEFSRIRDSHYLIWTVPIIVALTCCLCRGDLRLADAIIAVLVVWEALTSAILTVSLYDASVSHHIRTAEGMVFDSFQWVIVKTR